MTGSDIGWAADPNLRYLPTPEKGREYVVNTNFVLRLDIPKEATGRRLAKARKLNPLRKRCFLVLVPICVNYILPHFALLRQTPLSTRPDDSSPQLDQQCPYPEAVYQRTGDL